jgi:KUP system potassium uptake protein
MGGRRLLREKQRKVSLALGDFLASVFVMPPTRVAGAAVFLTAEAGVVPNAMLHNLKHNKVLHEKNLFVTVRSHEVPWIQIENRAEMKDLGNDCFQIILHYGFNDDPDVPKALHGLPDKGCAVDPMTTSYFLSREVVVPTIGGGMQPWREKLFAQMHHNASDAADFLRLPNNAVVEMGSKIEI